MAHGVFKVGHDQVIATCITYWILLGIIDPFLLAPQKGIRKALYFVNNLSTQTTFQCA